MIAAQVRKKEEKKKKNMRAEQGNLLLPVDEVHIRRLFLLIYWDELILTYWLGRVLPLGEVSRKTGIQTGSVARPKRTSFFFFLQAAGLCARVEDSMLALHTCWILPQESKQMKKEKTNHPHLWLPASWGFCARPCTPGKPGRSAGVSEENTTVS